MVWFWLKDLWVLLNHSSEIIKKGVCWFEEIKLAILVLWLQFLSELLEKLLAIYCYDLSAEIYDFLVLLCQILRHVNLKLVGLWSNDFELLLWISIRSVSLLITKQLVSQLLLSIISCFVAFALFLLYHLFLFPQFCQVIRPIRILLRPQEPILLITLHMLQYHI